MRDQPKPATGEWAVETNTGSNEMKRIMCGEQKVIGWTMRPFSESFQQIADAHNAALAAEREKVEHMWQCQQSLERTVQQLRDQLATEREASIEHAQVGAAIINDLRDEIEDLENTIRYLLDIIANHEKVHKV